MSRSEAWFVCWWTVLSMCLTGSMLYAMGKEDGFKQGWDQAEEMEIRARKTCSVVVAWDFSAPTASNAAMAEVINRLPSAGGTVCVR